jgi:hypothetical protein
MATTEPIIIPIEGDESDFTKSSAAVKRSLKDIGADLSNVSKIAQSAELRNLGQTLGRGLGAAANEVKALTSETVNYATEVRKLNYLTGAGAEESSRLIQLSDDLAISYGELGAALKGGAQNGIEPSTESLARLSDQYLQLQPGLEQSQFLMDKFGKSGMALAPMLEQGSGAIRQMSDDVSESMILNDQQIQQYRDYELVLGDFDAKIQGLRYSIGNDLIGAFMDAPKPIQDFGLALIAFGPQITGTIGFVGDLFISLNALGGLFKAGGLLATLPASLATAGTAVKTFGLAINTAMGPIGWLIAALGLLAGVMVEFGPAALTTFDQLTKLAEFKLTGKMPGFANGGSFAVAGGGGTDSQLVQFMATPGERVTVTPPGRGGGSGSGINMTNYFTGSPEENAAAIERKIREMKRNGVL